MPNNLTPGALNRATLVIPPRPRGRNRPPAPGGAYTLRLVPGGARGGSLYAAGPYTVLLRGGIVSVLDWAGVGVSAYYLRGV